MDIYGVFLLTGGIAMFLYGMHIMSDGLKMVAADNLRTILERATKNRITGVLIGMIVTAVIQSSSATTVMAMGFVNSGLMTLGQAMGLIMGANIGTTVTSQITAFDLAAYAPFILFVGTVMFLFLKNRQVRAVGSIIMGFGLLFVGISTMKEAIAPLQESDIFVSFLTTLDNPALAILFGLVFTSIVQSSSSSVVIFQAFAAQGLLSFHVAVYLVMGAAIGSCAPNLLAALTSNRDGKRTAILNVLFNLFRTAIMVVLVNLIPQFLELVVALSPGDVPRQIANAHTIFSVIAVVVELPFANWLVSLSQKIIPILEEETRRPERRLVYLEHLDRIPPAIAAAQAKREVCRMGKIARDNFALSLDAFFEGDESKENLVFQTEETVDYLSHEITACLVRLRSMDLNEKDTARLGMLFLTVADIERIGDHAENIAEYSRTMRTTKAKISDVATEELKKMSRATLASLDLCLDVFEHDLFQQLDETEVLEDRVDELEDQLINGHIQRLMSTKCDPTGGVIFTDLVTDLERCSDHAINIAFSITGKQQDA